MSFNFAEFLLNTKDEYNQHKCTEVSGVSVEEAINICKDLEDYTGNESLFTVEVFSDKSWTIHQKDYFANHLLGHRDRMILSCDGAE